MTEMPFYTCHKRVQALEIESVGNYDLGGDGLRRKLTFKEPGFPDRFCPDVMFQRYVPHPGDFLVRYEDGYESFSPRKAFLEGYTKDESAGNALMERLNDLSAFGVADLGCLPDEAPSWMQGVDLSQQVRRLAREAYVTINSLKFQLEQARNQLQQAASPVGWGGDHLKGTANAPKVD